MIPAARTDDDLLADIAAADPGGGFSLWWLGQSGFLLKCAAGHLLFDPYLSDALTRKYAETDKPHVRMTENPVDPARLDFIDVVTSSHNHTDHLDAETLGPLLQVNAELQLVIPEANRSFVVERLGIDPARPIGLVDGARAERAAFLHGVPAAHEGRDRDEAGRDRFLGYVVEFPGGCIYHSGDTILYEGMISALQHFEIDVALLPINGRKPQRRVSGNLWGIEAARLARDIGASLVVPCHYDMFTFNTETPDAFVAECQKIDQRFAVLRCGEQLS